ncbi:hypothetical protein [Halpernia sp. GG3]
MALNNKGGSFAYWTKTIKARDFDGVKYSELKYRYSPTNTGFNQFTGKGIMVSHVLKKGTIVATVILGAVEVGKGVIADVNDYNTKGETKGENTAVAAGSVAGGILGGLAGAESGATIGAAVGFWFGGVGVVPGALNWRDCWRSYRKLGWFRYWK